MVEVQAARAVAVLTRAPSVAGKRRLFEALGRAPDPHLLVALLLDTVDRLRVPGVTRVVAVEPPSAAASVELLVPSDVRVVGQPEGDLGDRMRATMETMLTSGIRAVALVGSDLPHIDPAVMVEAFSTLDRDPDRLVLGPADDGGYYLVAATAAPPVFDGIEWGSGDVLGQTLAVAARRGIAVHLLPRMSDVDRPADLRRVLEDFSAEAPRTAAWVRANLPSAF